ncbi:hypothetical protein DYB36_000716 [Aphanomyces astaci]|uniref:Uncharacterized protein n=1 Tax=Aphanomyces astaci TaxID=112090 RepID=A0A397B7Q7_APHAT|nr:hypothetical protein DYB36_000716 [Aphanomyces astaci]
MFAHFRNLPFSNACAKAGGWNASVKTTDLLTTLKASLSLACALPSCRSDIDASATNLLYMPCNEAQVLGTAMTRLRSFCQSFALALPPSLPCADSDLVELGPLTAQCFNVVPDATSLVDIVLPSNLATYPAVCKVPTCVASILGRIRTLSSCSADWPSLGQAPVSAKDIYQNYVTSFCNSENFQAANDFTSCNARVANLFATTFSDACVQAQFNGQNPTFILQSTITGTAYFSLNRRLVTTPACAKDIATVASRLNSVGNCSTDLTLAINTYQAVSAIAYASNPALPLCSAVQTSQLMTLLSAPAATVCTFNHSGVVAVQWRDVFLPRHLADLATLATPSCVAAALTYAKTFPACEYADRSNGDVVLGIDAATRISAYLVVAESFTNHSTTLNSNAAATWQPGWRLLGGLTFVLLLL